MKLPEKFKEGFRAFWQVACFVLAVLLLTDFLVCLIAAFVALDWLLNQAALAGGGIVLVFFVVMYIAAIFSMLEYIRHIKADDPG